MTTHADRSSFFVALVVVDVLAGLADAISGPYLVLFLVDQARLSPLLLSAVLTARAVAGIAFATGFGGWVDRKPSVAPLLLALAGSSVGYALARLHDQFRAPARRRGDSVRDWRGGLFPIDCARQTAFRPCKPSHRQSRHRRPSRQLVACLGHRTRDRRGRCRSVRISRRVLHQRRLRRDRPGDPCPCSSEAHSRDAVHEQSTEAGERRTADRPRLHGACAIPYRHVHGNDPAGRSC